MKKIKGFLAGVVVGITAALYSIWKWEKDNKKKFSSVAEKYYKQAKEQVDQIVKEYGPVANQKLSEAQKLLNEKIAQAKDLSKKDLESLKLRVNSYINSVSQKLKAKRHVNKKHSNK